MILKNLRKEINKEKKRLNYTIEKVSKKKNSLVSYINFFL